MPLNKCADCTTEYAPGLSTCPHCSSSRRAEDESPVTRYPMFLSVRCSGCSRGPWTVRLNSITSGLVTLPSLACVSCGSPVPVDWPPKEEPMSPKITVHGGATNARTVDPSPAADASPPQVVAEDDLGHPLPETSSESEPEKNASYDSMTLTELRALATEQGVPAYGTKAQIAERLREEDAS